MSKQRVLHIITGLETGGAETSLVRLVASTSQHVQHIVCSLTGRGTQASQLEQHGAIVFVRDWARGRITLDGVASLVRLVRGFDPEVLHGWMYHGNLVASTIAPFTGHHRRVIWSVRHSLDSLSTESRRLRAIIRASAPLSHLPARVLYNSARSAQQHERVGFAASKTQVLRNGVDTSRFAPDASLRTTIRCELGIDARTPVVGLIARVHAVKDHATFLHAARIVRERVPNARFILAGRGTASDEGISELSAQLALGDSLIRLGERADTGAIYNACDIVALTSVSEGFPNVVAEAMCSGIPCVVTDVGDAAEIVGDTGEVVPVGKPAACAEALGRLLTESADEHERRSVAARARIVELFSQRAVAEAHLALWREIGSRSRATSTLAARATPDASAEFSTPTRTPALTLERSAAQDHSLPAATHRVRVLHVLTASMSLHFLNGQREWFAAHGIDLHVATSPGAQLDAWSQRFPLTANAVPMSRSISLGADLRAVRALLRVIRHGRFDVVHAGTPKAGLLGMIAARLVGVPHRIYHVRGLPLTTASGWRRAILTASERVACHLATRIIAVSPSLREEMRALRLTSKRIEVLGAGSSNGVDSRVRFNPQSITSEESHAVRAAHGIPLDATVVGFVGRLTRDKGIRELASAWQTVRKAAPHVHLLMVGIADDDSADIVHVMRMLGNDERVHLHGADWNTPRLFAAMDLVVLPTYREGFPNVLLEAAAMERPVVATQVAGCVDAVVNGVTGTLVPAADDAALARAMLDYVSQPALMREHGIAARERVCMHFEREVIWRSLAAIYGVAEPGLASVPVDAMERAA